MKIAYTCHWEKKHAHDHLAKVKWEAAKDKQMKKTTKIDESKRKLETL